MGTGVSRVSEGGVCGGGAGPSACVSCLPAWVGLSVGGRGEVHGGVGVVCAEGAPWLGSWGPFEFVVPAQATPLIGMRTHSRERRCPPPSARALRSARRLRSPSTAQA